MNDVVVMRPAPALALGETLLKMLADPNISADKMQILLTMQKEIMAESRREAFQAAFAEMAPQMPQVERNGIVVLMKDGRELGRYRYAKWEDMDTIIRPVMHKHGFSLSFSQRIDQGKQVLVGTLMHSGGHAITSERPVIPDPGPGRSAAQAEGSGLSYAKRYVAEGLLNIVRKGVDNDAIGLEPMTPEHVKDIAGLLGKTSTKTETFLKMFVTEAETLEQIPERDYPRLKNALEQKLAVLTKEGDTKRGPKNGPA